MLFVKPARPIKKVFIHISASDNPDHDNAATIDAWHRAKGWSGIGYHFFIRKSGQIERGRDLEKTPAAQAPYNRGTIAICISGLKIGKVTKEELAALVDLCWQINDAYNGQVTFHGHREVANKTCPVIDYKKVLGISEKGYLAGTRPDKTKTKSEPAIVVSTPEPASATIRHGDKGFQVEALQRQLVKLGYQVGGIDNNFGDRTRVAVLAFQVDNHLITDGVVGAATTEALSDATPRQISLKRDAASIASLATDGSRIADASMKSLATGTAVSVSGIVSFLPFFSDTFKSLKTQLAPVLEPFGGMSDAITYGLLIAVAYLTWQAWRSGAARVEDHKSGKTS